jgi:hypothetical protein
LSHVDRQTSACFFFVRAFGPRVTAADADADVVVVALRLAYP